MYGRQNRSIAFCGPLSLWTQRLHTSSRILSEKISLIGGVSVDLGAAGEWGGFGADCWFCDRGQDGLNTIFFPGILGRTARLRLRRDSRGGCPYLGRAYTRSSSFSDCGLPFQLVSNCLRTNPAS